jgi:maltose-binding protein MalE
MTAYHKYSESEPFAFLKAPLFVVSLILLSIWFLEACSLEQKAHKGYANKKEMSWAYAKGDVYGYKYTVTYVEEGTWIKYEVNVDPDTYNSIDLTKSELLIFYTY